MTIKFATSQQKEDWLCNRLIDIYLEEKKLGFPEASVPHAIPQTRSLELSQNLGGLFLYHSNFDLFQPTAENTTFAAVGIVAMLVALQIMDKHNILPAHTPRATATHSTLPAKPAANPSPAEKARLAKLAELDRERFQLTFQASDIFPDGPHYRNPDTARHFGFKPRP